jgi:hypothetical protein
MKHKFRVKAMPSCGDGFNYHEFHVTINVKGDEVTNDCSSNIFHTAKWLVENDKRQGYFERSGGFAAGAFELVRWLGPVEEK